MDVILVVLFVGFLLIASPSVSLLYLFTLDMLICGYNWLDTRWKKWRRKE